MSELQLGFFADTGRLILGLTEQPRRAVLGPGADLASRLTGCRQHPRRLLAEQFRDGRLVEIDVPGSWSAVGGLQLPLQVALAFLQAAQLGRDHAKEVAHFVGIEATPRRREGG